MLNALRWLGLAGVNELCVFVFISFVNVSICNWESARSQSRSGFERMFCNVFELLNIEFLLWCMTWAYWFCFSQKSVAFG